MTLKNPKTSPNAVQNQKAWVRYRLMNGEVLTSMKCFPRGITRLASIISRLRDEGLCITTTMKDPKKKGKAPYAEYRYKGKYN